MSRRRQKDMYTNALVRWILGRIPSAKPKTKPARKTPTLNPTKTSLKPSTQLTLQPIELTVTKKIQLRPYQQEALQEFLKQKKCTLEMATATGKTFVAIEAIRRLGLPTVIIVPTIAILKTVWLRRLKEAGFGYKLGVFYGHKKQFAPILITTYHSAIRHPHLLTNYQLVIFDEVHHTKSEVWGKLLDYTKHAKYVLGLTATLGRRFDPKTLKITRVLPVAFTYQIYEARKQGWVAPIKVYSAPVEMNFQEWRKYDEYCQIIRKVIWELGTTDPTEWSKLAKRGDRTARKGLWALTKRRTLLSTIEAKLPMVLHIIRKNPDSKILLFSESIPAVKRLKAYLTANGIKCATYHSKMSKTEREHALRTGWGSQFKTLLAVRALDEGLDVPEANVGIIHCSGRTPRQIVQRLGRLIRAKPGKIAKVYVVWANGTIENRVLEAVKRAVWKVK